MPIALQGSRVLVAGGSSGIGFATARAFLDAGANVTVASRAGKTLDAAVASLGSASSHAFDLTDEPSIERLFDEPFDHVAISASSTKTGTLHELALDDAYASMNAKFFGAYRIARAAKLRDDGSITFVSGFLSHRPKAGAALQGAINAALEGLARGLALELAPVRVNVVSPGLIATSLYDDMSPSERDAMFAKAAAALPVRRVGQPEDIAQTILFLATNPYVTGSVVTVDGGASIA